MSTTVRPFDSWTVAQALRIRPALDELPDGGSPCWGCGCRCRWDNLDDWRPAVRVWLRPAGALHSIGITVVTCPDCARAALIERYGSADQVPRSVAKLAGVTL